MDIIIVLIPIALALGTVFAVLFAAAAHNGQFEDLDDPATRMLQED
ncbi:MAG: cbb3-type cytochrome oxidase maturation protein [Myxococcota bacterium]|jgi:cbb3-type cytochrome oxidase maturation protein